MLNFTKLLFIENIKKITNKVTHAIVRSSDRVFNTERN